MTSKIPDALNFYVSSAQQDDGLKNSLLKQLSVLEHAGLIISWHEHKVNPGAEYQREVDEHFQHAAIIALLISPDFLASDYCYKEMQRALIRHDQHEAIVIPIILRPSDWRNSPVGKLEPLPKNGQPVTSWNDMDQAFLDVAMHIRDLVVQRHDSERKDYMSSQADNRAQQEHLQTDVQSLSSLVEQAIVSLTPLSSNRENHQSGPDAARLQQLYTLLNTYFQSHDHTDSVTVLDHFIAEPQKYRHHLYQSLLQAVQSDQALTTNIRKQLQPGPVQEVIASEKARVKSVSMRNKQRQGKQRIRASDESRVEDIHFDIG